MKVIIIMIILVAVVMLVIFVLALIGVAGTKTALEQMLEDRDQREYLSAWQSRKRSRVNVPDIPADRIVHNVDSQKNSGENEKSRADCPKTNGKAGIELQDMV